MRAAQLSAKSGSGESRSVIGQCNRTRQLFSNRAGGVCVSECMRHLALVNPFFSMHRVNLASLGLTRRRPVSISWASDEGCPGSVGERQAACQQIPSLCVVGCVPPTHHGEPPGHAAEGTSLLHVQSILQGVRVSVTCQECSIWCPLTR